MGGLANIIEGNLHLIFKDEKVEALAKERAEVCLDCEHRQKHILGQVCGRCMCLLNAKTRAVNEVCPAKKWKE